MLCASLMLSGCLETMFAGTAGTITEFAKDRKPGETISDVRIYAAIKSDIIKKHFKQLYAQTKIEVVQGRVLFTGSIEKEEDAITAVQIAWSKEGVTEVINELKIDKNSKKFNLFQYTRDSFITSQIKSKTFIDRSIKFINYTVITLDDIVYLFGIARSEEELKKVASIASNISGVKKVISHVKIQKIGGVTKIKPEPQSNSDTDTDLQLDTENSGDIINDKILTDHSEEDLNLDNGI